MYFDQFIVTSPKVIISHPPRGWLHLTQFRDWSKIAVMPSRTNPFVTGQVYHLYNIGAEKRRIFESKRDYKRFLRALQYYSFEGPKPRFSHYSENESEIVIDPTKKIIEVLAYVLMPNHFHLLLMQKKDGGITEVLGKLSNSYTKFFNAKYQRNGSLFQGEFKSALIEQDERLDYISRYIHMDPVNSFLKLSPDMYEWSSMFEYLDREVAEGNGYTMANPQLIKSHFEELNSYEKFLLDKIEFAEKLPIIQHQILEEV